MRIETVPGGPGPLAQRAAVWVADQLWSAIDERDVAHLAVSGGTTPKAMFGALKDPLRLRLVATRAFPSGSVLLEYVPAT